MMNRLCRLLFYALLAAAISLAQTISGFISGTVTDPSGAVVPGAQVKLTNDANGLQRGGVTSETGGFSFVSVQPGTYSLSVEHTGFKSYRRRGMALSANERLPQDIQLEVGAAAEAVNVEARAATVQTNSAERADTVTNQQYETLPLKGRDFMGLLKLLPGVVDTNKRESPTNNSLSGLNISGNREGTYNLTLDGVTNLDAGSNTGPYFEPSADSVAEVHVLLSNYQAEYGRNSGGQINVVTKSGSREYVTPILWISSRCSAT